ncbi:MAG: enoyl-CoA hydratase [Rhodospirillaceae bacterium]|nr:enoyl-CoA hydratase [Rhodospirillaceae bacterium]
MSFETLIVEIRNTVGLIVLNRPQALNALSAQLVSELQDALVAFDADDGIGAVVVTGSERAFAAGADIKEMATKTYASCVLENFITSGWEATTHTRKPVIAAVAGFALGGGCELAMMCDIIIAADNASFGQPEIGLGIIPGAGGTQRLARAVGKAKAMDMVLTGRRIDAVEAERIGLVSRVVPLADLLPEALAVAETIAGLGRVAMLAAKAAVNVAFETTLAEGVRYERQAFHALFSTEDQKEGMAAFVERRHPKFRGC